MKAKVNRDKCKHNDWTGPVIGPMGGRWMCSHEPWIQPFTWTMDWNRNLGWHNDVDYKLVTGRYGYAKGTQMFAMLPDTVVTLGNIKCVQNKTSVTCYDRRTKVGFTAHANGKTSWKGVKGKVRTWNDIKY